MKFFASFFFFILVIFLFAILKTFNIFLAESENVIYKSGCKIRRETKYRNYQMWNKGNFIDLGANNGDSLIWFYNLYMKGLKYFVPYPRRTTNITKNFNTYIFEGNPNLCDKIKRTVEFIKHNTELSNFKIFCPYIVSTHEGVEKMTIDNGNDYSSSKYYESNRNFNRYRKISMVAALNFTKFLNENIDENDFNVMKFDVEGEEYFIIPELIKTNLLSKFDVLYSEFHLGDINNPLNKKANDIFYVFQNYTAKMHIETYEEEKITEDQLLNYNKIYDDLVSCRNGIYN